MKGLRLDLQFFAGEKTEKATPKKKQDSRKKGQVAKSQDVNASINLLTVFLLLLFIGPFMLEKISSLLIEFFQNSMLVQVTEESTSLLLIEVLKEMGLILAPILAAALIAGVAANYMQIGFMFSTETIQLKLEKLDPIKGFKRIFSIRAIVELLKSILKISVVGLVTFIVIWQRMDEIMVLSKKSIGNAMTTLADITVKVGIYASIALLVLSLLDYLYQKYDYEKNIRMSKQDIKDEYKNIEGDPLIMAA